ncbi:uncharacterized protein LOC123037196 [Drosophila rhopaloa]|uniref:Reverse transcriptase domain-containing protein n=1 Tax=Drosophila rhopaloa TaxID=1041015 RepID=A0ABM5J1Q3_DRORH|nr:uncharacterized protein LOC123037196 [Drosophila rhopaloa]
MWATGPTSSRRESIKGYVRAKLKDLWIFSCYFPPSWTLEEFSETIDSLAIDIRAHSPAIVAGDFNAWSTEWESASTNARGRVVTETRAGAQSIIDLTYLSASLAATATWEISETYTASDHSAIISTIRMRRTATPTITRGHYKENTLDIPSFRAALEGMELAENERALMAKVKEACDASSSAGSFHPKRKILKRKIKSSKRRCFLQLCDEAENDLWGKAYKVETRQAEAFGVPDHQIPPVTLQELVNIAQKHVPEHLASAYTKCLAQACFPERWKQQKLVLIPKPGKDKDEPSAYRPICLLDTAGKILESIVSARLGEAIEAAGGLSERQYGFRKARSTLDALEAVDRIARQAIEGKRWLGGNKQYCLVATLDIKNAFNSASWSRIMASLGMLNIPKYLQAIVSDYLSDRWLHYDTDEGPQRYKITGGCHKGPS